MSVRTACYKFALEPAVIFQHFIKCDRAKTVNINTGIQDIRPRGDQRIKIRLRIIVDMSVDHIRPLCVLPAQKRIVTQGHRMLTVRGFKELIYTDKISFVVELRHP